MLVACWCCSVASNTWNSIAALPQGVNHAATGTDGKLMYVFGGRGGGNYPSAGYNYVQVCHFTPNMLFFGQ